MKDTISALMDGELDDKSAAMAIDALARDDEALETWRTYHLISDALGKTRVLSPGFSARVSAGLAKEPTVLAPSRRKSAEPRRWVAMAAGVAAVSLVAWLGFAPQQSAVAPVAQAPTLVSTQVPTQVPKVTAPQESRVAVVPALIPLPNGANDYLLAHQAFSPRVSLQGMAPYVRTVSEQGQEPRK